MGGERETTSQVIQEECRRTKSRNKKTSKNQDVSRDHYASLEARLAKLELTMADVHEKVEDMEGHGDRLEAVETFNGGIEDSLLGLVNELKSSLRGEIAKLKEFVETELEGIKADYAMCKAAVAGGAVIRGSPHGKEPEPSK